jgi:hypothetical protein
VSKNKPVKVEWTPFERCTWWSVNNGERVDIPRSIVVMKNNVYTVHIEACKVTGWPFPHVTWLSIKRNDRNSFHDWRELQRVKNAICGPEREAFEIYPRESRLVDTSNQYHLWVLPEGFDLPFGYAERQVCDDDTGTLGSRQRPFAAGTRPADAMTGAEIERKYTDDPDFGTRLLHERILDEQPKCMVCGWGLVKGTPPGSICAGCARERRGAAQ